MKIRFATIGTSTITDKFLQAAALCPDFVHQAIYSRNEKTAQDFALKHPVAAIYTSLDDLARADDIDAVYIASPNAFHYEQAMLLIRAGKHVLCEKSIASNYREAAAMFEAAKENHVVLMEAMRSLPDPGFDFIRRNLPRLGDIRHVSFSFCQYSSRYDRFKSGQDFNIFSKAMSAGALMDIGVYCVEPLIALFGKPERILAGAYKLHNGIDGNGTILAVYESMVAQLIYSKITDSIATSEIQGELGGMQIDAIACPHHVVLKFRDGTTENYNLENEVNNMHYETARFIDAILTHQLPEEEMQITLNSMALMDEARQQLGIVFPADQHSRENAPQI